MTRPTGIGYSPGRAGSDEAACAGVEHLAQAMLVTAVGYYLASLFGLALNQAPNAVSGFWPANAWLLGVLLVTRQRLWWPCLLAIVPAHVLAHWPTGVPLAVMPLQIGTNAGQAVLAAWAMHRLASPSDWFRNVRATGIFIAFAALIAPAAAALVAAASFAAVDFNNDIWGVWSMRMRSNVLAVLTVTPLVVLGWRGLQVNLTAVRPVRVLEAGLLGAALVGIGLQLFSPLGPLAGHAVLLIYLPVPFFLWAAVRFGLAGVCLSVTLAGSFQIWAAVHQAGIFGSGFVINESGLNLLLIATLIPLMLLAVSFDEKRLALEQARLSQDNFRRLAETTAAIPWEADGETLTFTYVGPRARDLIGLEIARWLDAGFFGARVHPDDRIRVLQQVSEAVATGRDAEFEYRMTTVADETVWVQDIVNCERGDNGSTRLRGFMIDITERRRALHELQLWRRRIAHVSRVSTVGELTASISHDLNQPLTAILNNAEAASRMLEAEHPDLPEIEQIVLDILEADRRARDIVRRMRSLLQMSEVHRAPIDLNELIWETLSLISTEAAARAVRLEFSSEQEMSMILGDRVHLQQLLMNLILNAFEAMSGAPDGCARVEVVLGRHDESAYALTVSDTGPGIPESVLPSLFQPFETTKASGLGVGLSIAKRIVEAHEGRIWAENHADGARFHVVLPASY